MKPLEIGLVPLLAFVAVAAVLIAVAWLNNPGIGLSSRDLRFFVMNTAGRVAGSDPLPREALAGQGAAQVQSTPSSIDVEGSVPACPEITRNDVARWRVSSEVWVLGPSGSSAARIHDVDGVYSLLRAP